MLSNVTCCRDLSKVEHVAITFLIVAVCTSISLAYDCLGVVLELNVSDTSFRSISICVHWLRVCFISQTQSSIIQGVLSATPLIFIIPSACFLKLSPGRWFQGQNVLPSILISVGFFVMITGLTMTGLYPQDCSHGVEMFYCADANVSGTVPPAWNKQAANNPYTLWKRTLNSWTLHRAVTLTPVNNVLMATVSRAYWQTWVPGFTSTHVVKAG